MSEKPKYPEHEKLQQVKDKSQAIGEFLEWVYATKKMVWAKWITEKVKNENWRIKRKAPEYVEIDVFIQQNLPMEQTLAEFFGIDLNKIEQEKRGMLDEIRRANGTYQKEEQALKTESNKQARAGD